MREGTLLLLLAILAVIVLPLAGEATHVTWPMALCGVAMILLAHSAVARARNFRGEIFNCLSILGGALAVAGAVGWELGDLRILLRFGLTCLISIIYIIVINHTN